MTGWIYCENMVGGKLQFCLYFEGRTIAAGSLEACRAAARLFQISITETYGRPGEYNR